MSEAIWLSYGGDRYVELDRRGTGADQPDVLLRAADGSERWWTAAERDAAWIDPKCIDCDEEQGSCPGGRCRDCDMEYLFTSGSCRECHVWMMKPEMAGRSVAEQHKAGCSLRDVDDYGPRDDAELTAIRVARYGAP